MNNSTWSLPLVVKPANKQQADSMKQRSGAHQVRERAPFLGYMLFIVVNSYTTDQSVKIVSSSKWYKSTEAKQIAKKFKSLNIMTEEMSFGHAV